MNAKWMSTAASDTLSFMQLNLAQVLNTIAHEIRTPLAVSQGYLKLYLDGRLTDADVQRRAFQQTRDALGTLATLCNDMTKVGALSEASAPGLLERVPAPQLFELLKGTSEVEGAEWSGDTAAPVSVASNAAADLVRAVAIVAKAAFDEARDQPRAVRVAGPELTVLAGTPEGITALEAGPAAAAACNVNFARGGKGLKLIWAAFVLQQHRVHTWTHQDHRAAVGFRFPVVQA
jgi:signal transduction histidine kinase